MAPGWISRELYLEIPGATVADLLNSPKYPNQPDALDVIRGARFENTPRQINYGARVTFFFVPAVTGEYEFFLYNDNEAQLFVSIHNTLEELHPVVSSPGVSSSFSEAVKGNIFFHEFVQGERYAVRVLWKQGTGDSVLAVAARQFGDA